MLTTRTHTQAHSIAQPGKEDRTASMYHKDKTANGAYDFQNIFSEHDIREEALGQVPGQFEYL